MTAPDPEAQRLFVESRSAHDRRDTATSIELARQAIAVDPEHAEALEHLGTLLVTRRRAFEEGLGMVERAVDARPSDAGLWYALGWVREFAAHELKRRPTASSLDARTLYEQAADAFRQCLALQPEGKLVGDAEDLLDHVENELAGLDR
jgi:tetratricopeptide (TPR) repeat protein